MANDWIVAAWAVLCYRAVGAWFIGPETEDNPQDDLLIDYPSPVEIRQSTSLSRTGSFFTVAAVLGFLALPSVLMDNMPLPPFSPTTTPFTVGCVLPIPRIGPPLLDDFISETKKLNRANVLLWPEGAVRFDTKAARDKAFEEIGEALKGHYIGVGFEDLDFDDKMQSRRRTGLALIHQSGSPNSTTEVKLLYYKRHLVPSASLPFSS